MIRKIVMLVGIVMLLLPGSAALAGGWVVVTLEMMPEQIRAGQPAAFSFMVRQHGRTPTHDVSPVLLATHVESGQEIQVDAEPAAEKGLFTAEVNLPQAGTWEWSIRVEPFNQTITFAPLTALAGEQAAVLKPVDQGAVSSGPAGIEQAGFDWQFLLRWTGLALLFSAVCLYVLDRRRARTIVTTATDGQVAS